MTRDEALAEAKRRWGDRAFADYSAPWFAVGISLELRDGWPTQSTFGESKVDFESAFADASARDGRS